MPARVYTDPRSHTGLVELSGRIRWTDIAASLVALHGHPGAPLRPDTLWDCRGITGLDLLPDDLARLTALLHRLFPDDGGGRSAVLYCRDIEAQMARLATLRAPGRDREYLISRRLEEVLAFLGLTNLAHFEPFWDSTDGMPENVEGGVMDTAARGLPLWRRNPSSVTA